MSLKEKWGVGPIGVVAILVVFSLTGMTVVWARPFIFDLFGFTEDTSMWIKVPIYLFTIFPLYQVLILVYGTLFGQFRFFWEKEKKVGRAIRRLFTGRKAAR